MIAGPIMQKTMLNYTILVVIEVKITSHGQCTSFFKKNSVAKSVGAKEYSDCISAEGEDSPPAMSLLDMT